MPSDRFERQQCRRLWARRRWLPEPAAPDQLPQAAKAVPEINPGHTLIQTLAAADDADGLNPISPTSCWIKRGSPMASSPPMHALSSNVSTM